MLQPQVPSVSVVSNKIDTKEQGKLLFESNEMPIPVAFLVLVLAIALPETTVGVPTVYR